MPSFQYTFSPPSFQSIMPSFQYTFSPLCLHSSMPSVRYAFSPVCLQSSMPMPNCRRFVNLCVPDALGYTTARLTYNWLTGQVVKWSSSPPNINWLFLSYLNHWEYPSCLDVLCSNNGEQFSLNSTILPDHYFTLNDLHIYCLHTLF